jgi:uncharacterized protein DUF1629
MNVYRIRQDRSYKGLAFRTEQEGQDFFNQSNGKIFKGAPIGENWKPPSMIYDHDNDMDEVGWFSAFVGNPALSPRVPDKLKQLMEPYGEMLPFQVEGESYLAFNVTNVIDALDEGKSEMDKRPTGLVVGVKKFAFKEGYVSHSQFFKLKWHKRNVFLAADFPGETDFRQLYLEAGATGLIFQLVYSGCD